jgi:hypothetical protein
MTKLVRNCSAYAIIETAQCERQLAPLEKNQQQLRVVLVLAGIDRCITALVFAVLLLRTIMRLIRSECHQ